MSKTRIFARAAIGAALAMVASWAVAGPPGRVVSMNLCTDQLAMLVAGPGQLHAVSQLARDPESSVMADEAQAYAVTHGLAEEVFLMQPDLVIAGSYTTPATVAMLRRLGFPVEIFPPASSRSQTVSINGKIFGPISASCACRSSAETLSTPNPARNALWWASRRSILAPSVSRFFRS